MSKVTGIYIGRFQPFHLGHLSAVKQALREVDFLIIGIGSAQYKETGDNPFSAEERKKAIESALSENNIPPDKYQIIPIPDIHDNDRWPAHVQTLTPAFSHVFTGNERLVKELFEKHTQIPVTVVNKEIPVCATDIRKKMAENSDWETFLSPSVAEYLKKIDGSKRIRNSFKS